MIRFSALGAYFNLGAAQSKALFRDRALIRNGQPSPCHRIELEEFISCEQVKKEKPRSISMFPDGPVI